MTFGDNAWIQDLKKKIKTLESKEVVTVGPYDHDDLSCAQIAARAGVAHYTVRKWLCRKIIPTPKDKIKSGLELMRRWPNRHHFKREYAEALRDCVIIRKSSKSYKTTKAFKGLCFSMLKKFL